MISLGDNLSPDFTISVLNFGVSMGLIIIIAIAVCLVAMTVAIIKGRRATQAAELHAEMETTEMESGTYDDIVRVESHTIETESNEAYNYVMKHQAF